MESTSDRPAAAALSLRLRAATRAAHEDLEATPFSRQLSKGSIDLPSYAGYLTAMWHFHRTLETAVERADDCDVAAIWRKDMRRAVALEDDLEFLQQSSVGADGASAATAAATFSSLLRAVEHDHRRLVGLLYVAEGSRLGGRVLCRALLARHPLLADGGLTYLDGQGAHTGQHWAAFRIHLDDLDLGVDGEIAAVDGAMTGFRAVRTVFLCLS